MGWCRGSCGGCLRLSGGRGQANMSREFAGCAWATAQKEADRLKDEYLSTEHMLLALAAVKSPAKEVLSVMSGIAHVTAILSALKDVRWQQPRWTDQNPEDKFQAAWRSMGGIAG